MLKNSLSRSCPLLDQGTSYMHIFPTFLQVQKAQQLFRVRLKILMALYPFCRPVSSASRFMSFDFSPIIWGKQLCFSLIVISFLGPWLPKGLHILINRRLGSFVCVPSLPFNQACLSQIFFVSSDMCLKFSASFITGSYANLYKPLSTTRSARKLVHG